MGETHGLMGATHRREVNLLRQSTTPIYCIIKAKLIAEVERSVATKAKSRLPVRNQGIFACMQKMPSFFVSFWQLKMTTILLYCFGTILA
jgi:hypothetical protein